MKALKNIEERIKNLKDILHSMISSHLKDNNGTINLEPLGIVIIFLL